jgi:hypothetical protein
MVDFSYQGALIIVLMCYLKPVLMKDFEHSITADSLHSKVNFLLIPEIARMINPKDSSWFKVNFGPFVNYL